MGSILISMTECFQERSMSEKPQVPFGEMYPVGSIAEKIALAIANRLFLPVNLEYDRVFHFPARVAVITFFLLLIVVSLPADCCLCDDFTL